MLTPIILRAVEITMPAHYQFILSIPVADRPAHLRNCLESIHQQIVRYGYDGGITITMPCAPGIRLVSHWSKLDSKTHCRLLVVSHVLCISVGEALALYFLFIGVAVATGL